REYHSDSRYSNVQFGRDVQQGVSAEERKAAADVPRGNVQHLQSHAVHQLQYLAPVLVAALADGSAAADECEFRKVHGGGEPAADVDVATRGVLRKQDRA